MSNNFYNDRKHCDNCDKYVSYLMSMDSSFCTECGSEVRLLSQADWDEFNVTLQARRPKGGRPRKTKVARREIA